MGFPVGYTELFPPGIFLHLLYFLGHVRSLVFALFNIAGLSNFLVPPDMVVIVVLPEAQSRPHKPKSSTDAIRGMLPVIRYDELVDDPPESCAICLYEFEGGNEIMWLRGCRHVFHLSCLDRWIECDQDTCPLCRARLVTTDEVDDYSPEPLLCW